MGPQDVTAAGIRLVEVGPRDGLQNEARVVPLKAKAAFVDALSAAGLKEIEVGAFVSPKAVPQMADSESLFKEIHRAPGVVYSALVPNEKGLERARLSRVDKVAVFTAASETFNQRNINASIAESIDRFRPVVASLDGLPARGYVSTAFWCPYEGPIAPNAVVDVVKRLAGLGLREHSIGDTIGKATSDDVRRLLDALLKVVPVGEVFLHFHDTYGHAAANAVAAWKEYGVTGFDASTGGVGGCPYAPGAAGNVAMESLIVALRDAGAKIDVDPAALRSAAGALYPHLGSSGPRGRAA